ncbi:TIR domain-containing protein [Shewanella sp. VB17]|uniref:TIR domain-containing protein n=1 Tax=Shewanella sp. VB17 TaxID=2739432 RepID=UPI001565676A|nr:TIR domain-containing protein [Shewanella sp. VB17]NRD75588.1 TIR domain-containing protein [Shewanella sp. VB17]
MGKKVFVSYKHRDNNVQHLPGYTQTARGYVDYLITNRLHDEVYKGEGDEDISQFKNETIKTRLKDKIHDSSVTLVLISPNMKETHIPESSQWIPWEISYSLKEITRSDRMSHTNGILAIVLPDYYGSYSYYIDESCTACNSKQFQTNKTFQILSSNMFNAKNKEQHQGQCNYCGKGFYGGSSSYIETVKWKDFISQKDYYLNKCISIRDDRNSFDITKEV